jgi:hypothetical protein
MTRIATAGLLLAFTLGTTAAWAKIPPPPPPDDKAKAAAAEKKVKDDAAAAQAKLDQAAAEEKAVKNYQANMKKMGKPIPKPTPVVAAATPPQVMPGPGAAKGQETGKPGDNRTSTRGAADAKGHEKGAMTPSGNTPPKGNEMPADAKKK